jgi:hypothetical protein
MLVKRLSSLMTSTPGGFCQQLKIIFLYWSISDNFLQKLPLSSHHIILGGMLYSVFGFTVFAFMGFWK